MKKAVLLMCLFLLAVPAWSDSFTSTSPAGGVLPSGVTTIGGVVLDLVGTNGNRVVSQLAASTLFEGYYNSGSPAAYQGNPGTIGIQTGFSSAVLNALGGGLAQVAVRFSLFDGDTAASDFDHNNNTLLLNGVNFGNWSTVDTVETDSVGSAIGGHSGGGFRDGSLDTGWFYSNDAATLAAFWATLSGGIVTFQLNDLSPYDNFYDFTQGIDSGLINVGTGPIVNPGPASEPGSLVLLAGGLLALVRRMRKA